MMNPNFLKRLLTALWFCEEENEPVYEFIYLGKVSFIISEKPSSAVKIKMDKG